jgi:hypothetical protein
MTKGRGEFEMRFVRKETGFAPTWAQDGANILSLPNAASVEISASSHRTALGSRHSAPYALISDNGGVIAAEALIETPAAKLRLADLWRQVDECAWGVDRRLEVLSVAEPCGVRLILEFAPALSHRAYGDFRYFAPPALYDLNDLNEDGIEDYFDTKSLHYRDDRLNQLAIFAYHSGARLGVSLSRDDAPCFDSMPDREPGESAFFQRTDIGSLGFEPQADGSVTFVAAYPFAERTRSNALLVKARTPFAAFWPAEPGETLNGSWSIRFHPADDVHAALWSMWRERFHRLSPRPVELAGSLDEIERRRIDAALNFFIEEKDAPYAAGFVTNCHPQDGKQISNVIQFGFTGQNNLNAFNLIRFGDRSGNAELRRKGLVVLSFFANMASRSKFGFIPGFYNADTRKFGSWWTGLILPLAYAESGGDLESLMGPIYGHLREVIEALADREGVYLRCLVEEHAGLLAAYRYDAGRGALHTDWLAVCRVFVDFLISAQNPDGSWIRAYTLGGEAITEPVSWFGQTEAQQKSSTAVAVPLLVAYYEATGDQRALDAALRAGEFVRRLFVDRVKFNGGIHDSIYAKPQLVDGESIMFAMSALLHLHRVTKRSDLLEGAVRAGRLVVTWICLWDVPLPPHSTLARYGFRSTGWMACDSPGAGYIHPMGVLAVPDLVELGLASGERLFLQVAELLQAGCNETVALPGKTWGYAAPGLQEEGLLISWWFADDPMFSGTAFGGRGKGEGNKTCLPWISAVSVFAHEEMLARYGVTTIALIEQKPT